MKKILILLFLLFLTNCQVNDPKEENMYSDSKKFLQFEDGNFWIYKIYNRTWDERETTSIVKSFYNGIETINNNEYFCIINISSSNDSSFIYYKLNENNGYLYGYDKIKDSENFITFLSPTPGNYKIDYDNYPDDYLGVTISEETIDRFDENIKIMKHEVYDVETKQTYRYSDKYGYMDYWFHYLNVSKSRTLLGCYINYIAYGDTTFNLIE